MMNAKIRIKKINIWGKDPLATFIFLWYFCYEIYLSVFYRLGGSNAYMLYNIIFFGSVALYAITHSTKKLISSIVCYLTIALLFLVTIMVHPEYMPWYFERTYGIQVQFFRGMGGIWAFLVVSIMSDRKELLRNLRNAMLLVFVFLSFRFASAQVRGYWLTYGADYTELQLGYDLGFGYSMLVPTIYFATEAFLNDKKKYYILFAIGSLEILMGGSRGAIIWVVTVFPMMMPYKWGAMSGRSRALAVLGLVVAFPVAILIYMYYDQLAQGLLLLMARRGFSSRTLQALISGEISDANGRDKIYALTIQRIVEGGLLGNGVFGERLLVGERFRWGYAHNFFLEVYAAFGYLGGTVICAVLIFNIIRTAMNCRETGDQMIYVTFLGSAMKLMLSDSFWFNSSFWALLAILVMWHKQDVSIRRIRARLSSRAR